MDRGLREQSFACTASDRLICLRSRDVSSTASKTLQTSVIAFSVYFRSEAPLLIPRPQELCTAWELVIHVAVVLPFLAHASTIFFFRQYLLGTPKSLIEAGRIDGATEYGIFFRLIVPILKPAFSAMAILNGMNAWNNYLWPLLVIRSSEKYTLTLGLNTLINPYGDNYSLLVVGSFFSIIPIFILFVCFQQYFIEGMTAGAVKE